MAWSSILNSLGGCLSEYWLYAAGFVIMAVLVFLLLRLLTDLRDRADATLRQLLQTNPALCVERLEHNRRLRWIFREPLLLLYLLDGAMKLGDDAKAGAVISRLDTLRLEPRDKVEFYQKRLSYFVSVENVAEARLSRDRLLDTLRRTGAAAVSHYKEIAEEADTIVGVYLDRDTSLIKKLIGRAERTKQSVVRGITQYRVAKLAYFKGDIPLMEKYLLRAEKNLRDTDYAPIIAEAKINPIILNTK